MTRIVVMLHSHEKSWLKLAYNMFEFRCGSILLLLVRAQVSCLVTTWHAAKGTQLAIGSAVFMCSLCNTS